MPNFAIVVGIDAYANPDWELTAAVDDALRFADWATTAGGVAPKDLRLLLSPSKPVTGPTPHQPATARLIRAAIHEFQKGAGAGGERLFVYFAGHGSSAPAVMGGGDADPVLVPADVSSLEAEYFMLLKFSEVITALRNVAPAEQFFFIDACRDLRLGDFLPAEEFMPAVGAGAGPWAPAREDGTFSKQYVLYATSPGQRAFEETARGRGVFADILLDALRGRLPAASVWSNQSLTYETRFTTLSALVKSEVEERIKTIANREQFVQVPEPVFRGGDPVLARFTAEEMGTVPVRVRLGPREARAGCRVQLVYPVPGVPDGHVLKSAGPPAEQNVTLDVVPGVYTLQAQADGYEGYREPVDAYRARDIKIRLAAGAPAPSQPVPPAPGPDTPSATGTLVAVSSDPTATIVVRDADHSRRASGTGNVSVTDLRTGIYRVQLRSAEGGTVEQLVEVPAGGEAHVTVEAPGPRMGAAQLEMLDRLGIRTYAGYLHPTEQFSGFANASFASLLAFAAFAAHWPNTDEFTRLRAFGVPAMSELPAGRSAVMILIGVSGDRPTHDLGREEFLRQAQIVLRDLEGLTLTTASLTPLPGMPAAGEVSLDLEPGSIIAELRLPGRAPTRYALCALPDRLTLLTAAVEDSGEADVQQYLLPLRHSGHEYLMHDSTNIRRLEVAQRAYRHGEELPSAVHANELLEGKLLDPLLGALAGYALVHRDRPDLYHGLAMQNMLEHFGTLPDSHVLAGLCEPAQRDAHFTKAARLGVPVFADGFRALYAWCAEHARPVRSLWTDAAMLLPGSPWTAWVASRPVLRASGSTMQHAPRGWDVLERRRPKIDRVLPSIGRLIQRGSQYPYSATAFLIAPDVAVTMAFALPAGGIEGCVIDFADGEAEAPRAFPVTELLGTVGASDDHDHDRHVAAVRLGQAPGITLPEPMRLASRPPTPAHGRSVFVAGFPERDARVPEHAAGAFGGVYGAKRVQPGQLLGVSEAVFHHDCLTAGGNAGSPVLDVDSVLVLGVHFAGQWLEFKRGEAVPLWTPPARQLLATLGVQFEEPQ